MQDAQNKFQLNNWAVIGHQRVVETLQRSIIQDRINHAYLFVGPEGIGKKTMALITAQTLQCRAGHRPCQVCQDCREIKNTSHPDLLLLEREKGKIGIGAVRRLQHQLSLKSYRGDSYKIGIIDGADCFTLEAANALLKVLEEPVGKTVLMLLAEDLAGVLPTIMSRCALLSLNLVARADIEQGLRKSEKKIPPGQTIEQLARVAFGCPGRALSFINNPAHWQEQADATKKLLAVLDYDLNHFSQVFLTRKLNQRQTTEILDFFLEFFRDLLVAKLSDHDLTLTRSRRTLASTPIAKHYSLGHLKKILNYLLAAKKMLWQNSNPRLILENLVMILRYA